MVLKRKVSKRWGSTYGEKMKDEAWEMALRLEEMEVNLVRRSGLFCRPNLKI